MKRLISLIFAAALLVLSARADAILIAKTWKLTLAAAGTPQAIEHPSDPDLRYVPAFRVFNLSPSTGTNMVYVGDSSVSGADAENIYPQAGISFSNEQTYGQNEKMFDLQQIYFDADAGGTEVIITVIYDDGK